MRRNEIAFFILLIILIFLVVFGIIYFIFFRSIVEENICENLGCLTGENFVGSINSDKYYECSCSNVKRINKENIICFVSESDAQEIGYTKGRC